MSTPNGHGEAERRERRDELASLAGEVKTMEACVNGRASAESARIDGEIKSQRAEHSAELRAVLEAVKALSAEMKGMEERMEERRVADMKALKTELVLEILLAEERLRGETRLLKWGIGLLLAFAVPTFVRVFSPQLSALLFGG